MAITPRSILLPPLEGIKRIFPSIKPKAVDTCRKMRIALVLRNFCKTREIYYYSIGSYVILKATNKPLIAGITRAHTALHGSV